MDSDPTNLQFHPPKLTLSLSLPIPSGVLPTAGVAPEEATASSALGARAGRVSRGGEEARSPREGRREPNTAGLGRIGRLSRGRRRQPPDGSRARSRPSATGSLAVAFVICRCRSSVRPPCACRSAAASSASSAQLLALAAALLSAPAGGRRREQRRGGGTGRTPEEVMERERVGRFGRVELQIC